MTILDILMRAAGVPAATIRNLIQAGIAAEPDLADEGGLILARLDEALSESNLIALGSTILSEGKDVLSGKFNPRNHPSDAG